MVDSKASLTRVDLLDPQGVFLYRVLPEQITHMPFQSDNHRLMLCSYSARGVACPAKNQCCSVHIRRGTLALCSREKVHVNHGLDPKSRLSHYEYHAPGKTFQIESPSDSADLYVCKSENVLITKGSKLIIDAMEGNDRSKNAPRLCAHFHRSLVCHRGPRCFFVHALSDNSTTTTVQITTTNVAADETVTRLGEVVSDTNSNDGSHESETSSSSCSSRRFHYNPYSFVSAYEYEETSFNPRSQSVLAS